MSIRFRKWGFQCLSKFIFEMGGFLLQFFVSGKQFFVLPITDVRGKFKFIDSVAEIISLFKETVGIFTAKENAEFFERTIRAFDLTESVDCFAMPHGVSSGSSTVCRTPVTMNFRQWWTNNKLKERGGQ